MLNPFIHWIEAKGPCAPWLFLALFIAASFLMLWRLEVMSAKGFEGTVLGTLVMPYCSGMGNLIFAFILGRNGGTGADVMTQFARQQRHEHDAGARPAGDFLGHERSARGKRKTARTGGKTHELNRLSLLLTLTGGSVFHRRGLGAGTQRPD